jgi:hypothetical protein
MRLLETLVLIVLMTVVMLGLSIPLWWEDAQPHIFALPDYINGVFERINEYMEIFKSILKQL